MPVPTPHADTLIWGDIRTLDPAQPRVEAIGILDGKVITVGERSSLDGLVGPATRIHHFDDGVIYPGLVEPHMHYWASALSLDWVDCATRDGAGFADIVTRLKDTPPTLGTWTFGQGFDPSLLPGEQELTRDVLDAAVPDRPVVVLNASMHFAYANSRALQAAGITDDSPDPDGGFFVRNDGRLTGAVGEIGGISALLATAPRPDQTQLLANLVRINELAIAAGYTHTHDAGTGGVLGPAEVPLFHQVAQRFPGRVTYAILDVVADALVADGLVPFFGDDRCQAVAWKIVADGSNQGRSGYQRRNYLGRDFRGAPNYSTDALTARMARAHQRGWPLMVHANGDAEIDQALAGFAQILDGDTGRRLRDRIEHCSFAHPEQLDEMARLEISPSFLMNHLYYWGHAFQTSIVGAQQAELLDPFGSAHARNLVVSMHSDYTVTELVPFREIQTAVTRKTRVGETVLNPAERVSADVALHAKTTGAAWQVHREDVSGRLSAGTFADLVVLDRDPLGVNPETIAETTVLRTVVGGQVVFEA